MRYDVWHWQYPGVYQHVASAEEDGCVGSIAEGQSLIAAAIESGELRGDWGQTWIQPEETDGKADIAAAVYFHINNLSV